LGLKKTKKQKKHRRNGLIEFEELKNRKEIGRGTSGTVFSATFKGETVAVKLGMVKDVLKELRLMVKLQRKELHPNVIKLKGICVDPEGIVMEYMKNGNLLNYLQRNPKQRLCTIFEWGIGISKGMEYLHQHQILHRDLALRNMLVGEIIKVSDFGLSKILVDTPYTSFTGDSLPCHWLSPECWEGKGASKKGDVWSFGVTLWEMMTLRRPYNKHSKETIALNIKNQNFIDSTFQLFCPQLFFSVIQACLKTHSSLRPDFTQLVYLLEGNFQQLSDNDKYLVVECGEKQQISNIQTEHAGYAEFPNN